MELLRRLGQSQVAIANATKQKMAVMIVSLLVSHEEWSTADVTNVQLASSSQDLANPSMLTFGLELVADPPTHLFFPPGGMALLSASGGGSPKCWCSSP